MHVISQKVLRDCWDKHPNSEVPLRGWYRLAKQARWTKFADVRETFRDADLVDDRVVFNVSGGRYRLIARIDFRRAKLYTRAVLTHAEYDRDDWKRKF